MTILYTIYTTIIYSGNGGANEKNKLLLRLELKKTTSS